MGQQQRVIARAKRSPYVQCHDSRSLTVVCRMLMSCTNVWVYLSADTVGCRAPFLHRWSLWQENIYTLALVILNPGNLQCRKSSTKNLNCVNIFDFRASRSLHWWRVAVGSDGRSSHRLIICDYPLGGCPIWVESCGHGHQSTPRACG